MPSREKLAEAPARQAKVNHARATQPTGVVATDIPLVMLIIHFSQSISLFICGVISSQSLDDKAALFAHHVLLHYSIHKYIHSWNKLRKVLLYVILW